jgi:hypothetical protein
MTRRPARPTFAASCPCCGDVELAVERMWLVVTGKAGRDHYAFVCPRCERLVRRSANPVTVRVLQRLVAVEELSVPAEVLEPRAAGPLTVDDLIDLMLALDAPVELSARESAPAP